MIKFILLFLFFFLFWRSNAKTKGTYYTPSSFLFLIYLIGAFCGIFTINIEGYRDPLTSHYWLPVIFFAFSLFLYLYPFKRFDETKIDVIKLPSLSILNLFSTFLIVISFFAIAYYASTVSSIFVMASLGDARQTIYEGELYVESGLMNTIASVAASLYVFAILMFFVYSAIGGHTIRRTLLLVSSISQPLHILSYVGRDGVVFWIFTFVFTYLLFRPFLTDEIDKKVKKIFLIGSASLLIPFILISLSRFSLSDTGTGGSFVSYMGQGFVVGPLFFGLEAIPMSNGSSFPLYWEVIGQRPPAGQGALQIGEWKSWQFGTFVTSFSRNLGVGGMLVLSIFCFLWFAIVFGRKRKIISFHSLFIYNLFFQVYSQGVFYFCQSTRGGNLFIVICFLLFFLFSMLEKQGNNVYLCKRHQYT